jgi:hypothetical protein
MKKLTLVLLFMVAVVTLPAQQIIRFDDYNNEKPKNDDEKVQTVFNSIEIKRISGFGGPSMSYSTVNGEFAFLMGGGGGVIINNVFFGGYGEGLSNSITTASIRNLEFGHGGLWFGYEIAPKSMIHPVISTRAGWGSVSGLNLTDNHYFADAVFVVVPTVSAEINFTRFFKINVGAEYRQALNVNKANGLSNSDFSAIGVNVNFLFGWF